MHHKYFKDQISIELNEACAYLKKAIDVMNIHPDWAKKLKEISEYKERIATELYKMFIQFCSETKGPDAYITSIRDAIMNVFSDSMRKLEDYETVYDIMLIQESEKEVLPDERSVTKSGCD